MVPRGDNTSDADAKNEWAADIKTHLARARLTWDFQVQFFKSAATTLIENPSVGRLTIPGQGLDDAAFSERIEKAKFDP